MEARTERRNKARVQDAILDAVIDCKYETGGGDVQLTQVAARAGVSTRTLNRYYPDKDKMIYMAAIRFLNGKYAAMSRAYALLDLEERNGLERIRSFLKIHEEYYRLNPADATMVDSANLTFTLGSLEADYPKVQIGLSLRKAFLDDIELGRQDGSIRQDLDARHTWAMVSSTYKGLLHRLAYLNATKCESIDRETFFRIYDDFICMVERYLQP